MKRCTTNPEHSDRPAVTERCVWRGDPCQCCEECRKMCLADKAEAEWEQ